MAASDYIVSQLREALRHDGTLPESTTLENFKETLFVDTHADQERDEPGSRPYMPILELVVDAHSAHAAQVIANTWARLFTRENADLFRASSGTLDFIDSQYLAMSGQLFEFENELKAERNFQDKALLDLRISWLQKMAEFEQDRRKKEHELRNLNERAMTDFVTVSEELKSKHVAESERLEQEFLSQNQPDSLEQELAIRMEKRAQFLRERLGIELQIRVQQDMLEQIRKQIGEQPRFLTLSKGMSDDGIWSRLGSGQPELPEQLQRLRLESEQLNPAHQALLDRHISAQIEYNTLVPQREHLAIEIDQLILAVDALEQKKADLRVKLHNLREGRRLDFEILVKRQQLEEDILRRRLRLYLDQLIGDKEAQLTILQQTRDSEVAGRQRAKKIAEGRLDRQIGSLTKAFQLLSEKTGSAQLAKAEQEPDVRLGALAVAPETPINPRPLRNTVLGGLIGMALSILTVFSMELGQLVQHDTNPLAPAVASSRRRLPLGTRAIDQARN